MMTIETAPVMALRPRDVGELIDELQAYHAIYSPLFQCREQRYWPGEYLRGLLLDMPRKSIEPMMLTLHGADPNAIRAMQQFVGEGSWDDQAILKCHWREVDDTLGDEDGVLTFDGSDFLKQGKESVGVTSKARSRSGSNDNTVAKWVNVRTAKPGCLWVMPVMPAIPCWIGVCICPSNGLKGTSLPSVEPNVGNPAICGSAPSRHWAGR